MEGTLDSKEGVAVVEDAGAMEAGVEEEEEGVIILEDTMIGVVDTMIVTQAVAVAAEGSTTGMKAVAAQEEVMMTDMAADIMEGVISLVAQGQRGVPLGDSPKTMNGSVCRL